jgi:hypothetical protein
MGNGSPSPTNRPSPARKRSLTSSSEARAQRPISAIKAMENRVLGNPHLRIALIGFGAWAIGGYWEFGWGAQDDVHSIAAIHRALELGVNWIDTAAVYGFWAIPRNLFRGPCRNGADHGPTSLPDELGQTARQGPRAQKCCGKSFV